MVMTEHLRPPWPLVEVAVQPKHRGEQERFAQALAELAVGDPSFQVTTDPESGQTVIGGMSEAHLYEKLGLLRHSYDVDCYFGSPLVSYRETIAGRVVQDHALEMRTDAGAQSGRVRIAFEPDAAIGRCRLVCAIRGSAVSEHDARAVERGIGATMGILVGAPLTRIRATLMEAETDGPGSPVTLLEAAARNALREALQKAGTVVLEPVMRVGVTMPERYEGAVAGDLRSRRGRILGREVTGDAVTVTALAPLANLFGYEASLRALSEGRASYAMPFDSYQPMPPRDGAGPPPAEAVALRA